MARHTESHALLPGVEYHPASRTLYVDVGKITFPGGDTGVSDAMFPLAMNAFLRWKKRFPEKPIRQVCIKGCPK